jgi:sec-independent protein translocase protein TatA
MFGLGLPELIVIFVIALVVFGPKKLPDLGKSVGRAMAEFKKAQQEFQESVQAEMKEVEKTTNLQEVKELASMDLKAYENADAGATVVEQAAGQKPEPEPEHNKEESKGEGAKSNG